MTKNIKEIGKELLGKSLNSFHRKTGLTQLEKNNEMQDGILNGILSQVDDAYIEKTEQSNVIHLDGSGDGVVVVDSIEGNTMVNLVKMTSSYIATVETFQNANIKLNQPLKANTVYTRFYHVKTLRKGDVIEYPTMYDMVQGTTNKQYSKYLNSLGWHTSKFTNLYDGHGYQIIVDNYWRRNNTNDCKLEIDNFFILEGDWTDKPIPTHFEGLQSSFEEKVNENGKYEIEILSNNRNLCNNGHKYENWTMVAGGQYDKISNGYILDNSLSRISKNSSTLKNLKNGETYTISFDVKFLQSSSYNEVQIYLYGNGEIYGERIRANGRIKWTFVYDSKYHNIGIYNQVGSDVEHLRTEISNIIIEKTLNTTNYIQQKYNKIKLLLNEPLRAIGNIKDRLCVKNNKLVIERNIADVELNGDENWRIYTTNSNSQTDPNLLLYRVDLPLKDNGWGYTQSLSNTFNTYIEMENAYWKIKKCLSLGGKSILVCCEHQNLDVFKQWLQQNPTKVVYQLAEPYYEEVTNEYGEPIILEGYENGTLYIDSTIVPTTTVRYTPKMESLNTLKEVSNNNVMLTNDINDTIIPYMMEVDLMIMEKEVTLMSQKNIRKIGVEDMTSMQKRTQQMLERLIKGKTLTVDECKTRVTVYLNADKITDAQAEELILLIDEVYA